MNLFLFILCTEKCLSSLHVLHHCLAINFHLEHGSPLAPAGANWEPEATLALHGDLSYPLRSVLWLWLDSGFLQILLPGHFEQDFQNVPCLKDNWSINNKSFLGALHVPCFWTECPWEIQSWGAGAVFVLSSLSTAHSRGQFLSLQASLKTFSFSSYS